MVRRADRAERVDAPQPSGCFLAVVSEPYKKMTGVLWRSPSPDQALGGQMEPRHLLDSPSATCTMFFLTPLWRPLSTVWAASVEREGMSLGIAGLETFAPASSLLELQPIRTLRGTWNLILTLLLTGKRQNHLNLLTICVLLSLSHPTVTPFRRVHLNVTIPLIFKWKPKAKA